MSKRKRRNNGESRGKKSREAREGEERVSKLVFCYVGLPCQQKKSRVHCKYMSCRMQSIR